MTIFRYDRELTTYRRDLPHWEMEGGIYFITTRLADSVPEIEYRRIQSDYNEEMARLKKGSAAPEVYEAFFEEFHLDHLDGLLDRGRGSCDLGRDEVAQVLWDSIQHFDGERYQLIAAVIMPNHIHVVFKVLEGYSFAKIVGAWKSFTYNEVRKKSGIRLKWQSECFDRIVRDMDELRRVVDYVLRNPQKAGLEDWPWVKQFMAIR